MAAAVQTLSSIAAGTFFSMLAQRGYVPVRAKESDMK
jgi:hypothetical protein